jgi:hypothetical protein
MTMRKLLMNCDQVFEALTRGPFPTGAESDEAVEHHLRCCHECRALAEALQPAVELMHEAIAPEHAVGLPEYSGLLASIECDVATAQAERPTSLNVRQLARPESAVRRPVAFVSFAQFAVALVVFAAVGSVLWGVIATAKHNDPPKLFFSGVIAPSGPKTLARLDDRGLMTLVSLNLPAKCFPKDALIISGDPQHPAGPPATINQAALVCCTECHNADHPQRALLGTVAAMQRSCVACHSL